MCRGSCSPGKRTTLSGKAEFGLAALGPETMIPKHRGMRTRDANGPRLAQFCEEIVHFGASMLVSSLSGGLDAASEYGLSFFAAVALREHLGVHEVRWHVIGVVLQKRAE